MLESKENNCRIEGILSEVDIKPTSFQKDGKTVNAIGGTIKIRVDQRLSKNDDKMTTLEVPVTMFASQYTNSGSLNPAYESINKILSDYTSIAASDIEHADRVRITSGQIKMNEYYGQNGNLISFPRINASFITKVKKEDFKPSATFSVTFAVANAGYELNKDDVETDKYYVTGVLPQYGGKVDVIKFYTANKNVTEAISEYWNQGDTVRASGRLNFSSRTETVVKEVDFGDPIEDTRTVNVSELLITGGSSTPLEGDFAFDQDEIVQALAERKARLAELKDKKKTPAKKAPVQTQKDKFADLGF